MTLPTIDLLCYRTDELKVLEKFPQLASKHFPTMLLKGLLKKLWLVHIHHSYLTLQFHTHICFAFPHHHFRCLVNHIT